ncbi:MAG TPA: TM0106 family RecB-like putative nuclease [Acidimicrobiales bacterium]|nr:TM0106 family RecB-like putative nuclease [Acidimicrobiales bacterium]
MVERLLTPSKITAWLGCGHYLSLRNQVDSGLLTPRQTPLNALAEILIDKGNQHEASCLEDYEALGKTIYEVPGRNANESFEEWVKRVSGSLDKGFDVIYQMPFVHDGMRGIADFLVLVDEPGYAGYEPVDAKLTRSKAKPGHVLQLCFYAESIAALTGVAPKRMHIWLGSGTTESLVVEEFMPYWRRLRRQLETMLESDATRVETRPRLCESCEYCEFQGHCEAQWRAGDALAFVANSRDTERLALEESGVTTVAQLARRVEPVADLREEKRRRLMAQASLQVTSRSDRDAPPAFEFIEVTEDPVYGHGFEFMPRPDQGDIFFDFEGDPFWTPEHDLMFLAGLLYQDDAGEWIYDERWAHDLAEQQSMIKGLVGFFAERAERYPHLHVYHYNHTEKSAIERLMRETEDENLFASLVERGLFVDLFTVAKNAVRVGTESYGLKYLEQLVQYERSAGIEQGAGAVVEYEEWMREGDEELLRDIARYNRDDVEATRALRDWLVEQRPEGLAWREAILTQEAYELDTDELVEGLHLFDEHGPEYLLGDLLNYWRRERSADVTPKYVALNGDYSVLYDHLDYVANLEVVRMEEPTGRERTPRMVLRWPEQVVDHSLAKDSDVLFAGIGAPYGKASITAIDFDRREVALRWGVVQEESGGVPSALTRDRYFRPGAKASVLKDLARQVLAPEVHGTPSRLSLALLARERPRFVDGSGPREGVFSDDLDSVYPWVNDLDESFVAFQGPPGTGKTYSGSHIIHHLVMLGKRVGVVAMSHTAIDNLMSATYDVFEKAGDLAALRTLRWQNGDDDAATLEFAKYSKKSADLVSDEFNLIGGTAWLWAKQEMRQNPVDVLIVDEAGQLALADAVASANGARSMLLLGDPLQLSQVAKAEHPGGSGASILQHVLGEHLTVPDTQGVFLAETWRLHPDVCRFISQQIYEGRLTSQESCRQQSTEFGTGLRWLEAHHRRRSTDSPEEAEVVAAQIAEMVGTKWVDQNGEVRALHARDFMVVAPYNDQVSLLRTRFQEESKLAGVQVGTVDKFQGREAPVVFFTMTTSSAEDMPRGPEFLFSRNRLNVAVSRARCLAYLVCTEELLNSRASDLDDMRLISTLSAFVEYAQPTGE